MFAWRVAEGWSWGPLCAQLGAEGALGNWPGQSAEYSLQAEAPPGVGMEGQPDAEAAAGQGGLEGAEADGQGAQPEGETKAEAA